MRIGIDTRYICDHFPGIGRYLYNLVSELAPLIPPPHTLVLLTAPHLPNTRHDLHGLQQYPAVTLLPITAPPFSLREHIQLPALARMLRLDLLHSPYYVKPYLGMPCPSVVTIHDLIGVRLPDALSFRSRILFNLMNRLAVQTSHHIITVSNSSCNDICSLYGVPTARITVTPEAADQRFSPRPAQEIATMRQHYSLPSRYVLFVGSNKPHKNLERLVLAWEHVLAAEDAATAGVCLVLAGHEDPRYPQARHLVEARNLAERVRFLPNIAEDDLPALYSGADLFVFPSFYEGFGLPPLEAMACGVPVVCANASSLPEVVGDAALLIDPHNTTELAENIQWVLASPSLHDTLRERSRQRARAFSWQRMARETLAVYEHVVSTHSKSHAGHKS